VRLRKRRKKRKRITYREVSKLVVFGNVFNYPNTTRFLMPPFETAFSRLTSRERRRFLSAV
jgi:hypothetical protein